MPLYITDTISEVEIQYNPDAVFIYFDCTKENSTHIESLNIKMLPNTNREAIFYRSNMNPKGDWDVIEYKLYGKKILNRCFDNIKKHLKENKLVIFPVRSFGIIKSTVSQEISADLERKFIEIANTNPGNKDKFEYYAF
jgi:hypothetical protein|tara:strand:+ start:20 stop:436 length:417 start_codon:yes stop_codon:yes gene_type:complete